MMRYSKCGRSCNSFASISGLAIVVTVLCLGCGPTPSAISGKVTYEGKPITTGTIVFVSQNGKVVSGNIWQGEYQVEGVEIGPGANVSVISHVPSPMMRPPTGPIEDIPQRESLEFVPIPDRYASASKSGLVCEVVEGEQTHDFSLQP